MPQTSYADLDGSVRRPADTSLLRLAAGSAPGETGGPKARPYSGFAGAGGGWGVDTGKDACATGSAVRTLFRLFSTGVGRENVSKLDTYARMKL